MVKAIKKMYMFKYILVSLFCLGSSQMLFAQNSDPSLDETIVWIQTKVSQYSVEKISDFEYNNMRYGCPKVYAIYGHSQLEAEPYSFDDGYGELLDLRKVINFKVFKLYNKDGGDYTGTAACLLFTEGNAVHHWNPKENLSFEDSEFHFRISLETDEKLDDRLTKALETLVRFNKSDKPKEAF